MFFTSGKRHLKITDPAVAATVAEARESFARGDATITLSELFDAYQPGSRTVGSAEKLGAEYHAVETETA